MSTGYWLVFAASLVLLIPAAWQVRRYLKSYIGFGWVLEYDKQTGFGRVLSRLTKGPAGKAGIYQGDILLSCELSPLSFASAAEMKEFWKKEIQRLKVGDRKNFRIRRDGKVLKFELEAEVIYGRIPVYDPLPRIPDEERHLYSEGLMYDKRVSQWVPTRRLSEAALDEILG